LTRALWSSFFTIAGLVALGLAIALGVGAPDPGVLERAAAGALGLLALGIGSIVLSTAVKAPTPTPGRPAGPEELSDARSAALVTLERSLRFGSSTAGDFYVNVRSRLVPLTTSRLARLGVSLSDKASSVALLGEDGYALVDPGAGPPKDRFGRGVSLDRVAHLVRRLEELGDVT